MPGALQGRITTIQTGGSLKLSTGGWLWNGGKRVQRRSQGAASLYSLIFGAETSDSSQSVSTAPCGVRLPVFRLRIFERADPDNKPQVSVVQADSCQHLIASDSVFHPRRFTELPSLPVHDDVDIGMLRDRHTPNNTLYVSLKSRQGPRRRSPPLPSRTCPSKPCAVAVRRRGSPSAAQRSHSSWHLATGAASPPRAHRCGRPPTLHSGGIPNESERENAYFGRGQH